MPRSEEAPYEVVNELEVNVGEENHYSEVSKRATNNNSTDVNSAQHISTQYAVVFKNSLKPNKDADGSATTADKNDNEEERLPPVPAKPSVPEKQSTEYYNLHGRSSDRSVPGPAPMQNNMYANDQDKSDKKPDITVIAEKGDNKGRKPPAIPSKPVSPEKQSNNISIKEREVPSKIIDTSDTTAINKPDLHKPSPLAVDDVEKPKLIKPKPHLVRPTASSDTNKRYVCVDLLIHFFKICVVFVQFKHVLST